MYKSFKPPAPSTSVANVIITAFGVLLTLHHGYALLKPDCQCYLFQSKGRSSGHFKSPNFPLPYPSNLSCVLYTFVGDIDEIVELKFHEFNMRPRQIHTGNCTDTIRLYLNLHQPKVNEFDAWNEELCGTIQDLRQSAFYSRDRVIIMYLHTDSSRGVHRYTGFKGMFTFLRKDEFRTDGIQLSVRHKCVYYFNSTIRKKGRFFSPGYPQNYPAGSSCDYQFVGKEGERILINLNNIKLDGTSNRCDPATAGDRLSAYDGLNTHDSKLAHFCGLHNGPQVVSHGNTLLVHFQSDKDGRTAQGFAADYIFVLKWSVQPTKIIQEPMRGDQTSKAGPDDLSSPSYRGLPSGGLRQASLPATQGKASPEYQTITENFVPCEEEFESSQQTKSGIFTLPRTPYDPGLTCLFKIKALPDELVQLNLHNVRLDDIGSDKCPSYLGDRIEIYDGMSDAQIRLGVVCGKTEMAHRFFSNGPHMTVKFVSDMKRHPAEHGFKATYQFIKKGRTDETMAVTEAERQSEYNCRHNVFSKNDKKRGNFYTPGFPNGYQPGINCHWRFFGLEFERVQIEFIEFSLNKPPKTTVKLSPTERCLNQDHVKIYKFYYKASIGQVQRDDEAITYCGDDRPISVMSARKARLEMSFVASVSGYGNAKGIHFRYAFLSNFGVKAPKAEQVHNECTFHFSSWKSINGSFTSPNYPGPYPEEVTCEYILQGRNDETVFLVFDDFELDSGSDRCDPRLDDFVLPESCTTKVSRPVGVNEGSRRICTRPSVREKYKLKWNQPCLRLTFHSNQISTRRGFFAYYFFQKNAQPAAPWETANTRSGASFGGRPHLLLTALLLLLFLRDQCSRA